MTKVALPKSSFLGSFLLGEAIYTKTPGNNFTRLGKIISNFTADISFFDCIFVPR